MSARLIQPTLAERMAANPALSGDPAAVAVIVPVHDARAETLRCLESIALSTRSPFRLIVIDDGSTDPELRRALRMLGGADSAITLLEHGESRGFVAAVNAGIGACRGDVVLLNSDTVVPPGWLERLRDVAAQVERVATITPLTNDGTICSVPAPWIANELPPGHDVRSFDELCHELSERSWPEVPTGVGFCMYVSRRALDEVGTFDESTFGRGYGEENDFCLRARRQGFVNVIADHVFVYHSGGASFGGETAARVERALPLLEERHPGYRAQIEGVRAAHPLAELHARIERRLASEAASEGRLRILHLLHEGGGTEKHARELAAAPGDLRQWVGLSDGRSIRVEAHHGATVVRRLRFPLERMPTTPIEPQATYRAALATIIACLDIDLVHVHHLMHHTVDIEAVCRDARIPYVVTLHDFYVVCPRYHLVDPSGAACGRCITEPEAAPIDCHGGRSAADLGAWQEAMRSFLAGAGAVLAPSAAVRERLPASYPVARVEVVAHGTDLEPRSPPRPAPGRLRVATIGHIGAHKGLHVIERLIAEDLPESVEIHHYGTVENRDWMALERDVCHRIGRGRLVMHGRYDACDLADRLAADGVSVALIPSIWPETFCFALNEAVAAGLPVIASADGATGERIRAFGLGWSLDDMRDAGAIARLLGELAADRDRIAAAAVAMRRSECLRPLRAMWDDTARIYDRVTASVERSPRPPQIGAAYVRFLAAHSAEPSVELADDRARAAAELDAARRLLRSPRHRIATKLAVVLQRLPIVWPVVSRLTEAWLARERERRARARAPSR